MSLLSRVSTVNLVLISPLQPTGHPEVTYKSLWAIQPKSVGCFVQWIRPYEAKYVGGGVKEGGVFERTIDYSITGIAS